MATLPPDVVYCLGVPLPPDAVKRDVFIPDSTFQPKYIDSIALIRKLNESFGYAWSDEIISITHSPDNTQVMVSVKLTVNSIIHAANGSVVVPIVHQAIGQARLKLGQAGPNGHVTFQDYAYDVKAAHTDGIRKAATKLGIGLEAYTRDEAAFQGLPKVAVPPGDANASAHAFQITGVVAILEGTLKLTRAQWLHGLQLQAPEQLTVGVASQILAGNHPMVVHYNGGRPLQVKGLDSSDA